MNRTLIKQSDSQQDNTMTVGGALSLWRSILLAAVMTPNVVFCDTDWEVHVFPSWTSASSSTFLVGYTGIYVTITGTSATSPVLTLENPDTTDVSQGSIFRVKTPDLGTPTSITIWQDKTGHHPDWQLGLIWLITGDFRFSPWNWRFTFNTWMTSNSTKATKVVDPVNPGVGRK